MKLLLTYGPDKVFEAEADIPAEQLTHIKKHCAWVAKPSVEKAAFMEQLKTDWLAKLPEEERAAYLAVEALPEDERKLEYAKQQQAFLQAKLAQVESAVDAMTAAVAAKPILKSDPIEKIIP